VFDDLLLPHLDAAYNLARWLMGNGPDAEDVVQDACVRAMAAAGTMRGENPRAWLLAIVRNGCYSVHRQRGRRETTDFDEQTHTDEAGSASPETVTLTRETSRRVRAAIADLAPEFREVIVLREFEGLSYKEIAAIADTPIGTVMSRLARARAQLQAALRDAAGGRP
jgi:RNA polymerase sigma-70 factor (ECF subfamily)